MDRYSRNKILKFIGDEGQKKILKAKVLILGAGGVGSNVLVSLSALGVGHIGLVDNDTVNLSNLNRQIIYNVESIGRYKVDAAKEWVNKFNPDIDIKTYCLRLNDSNYKEIYKDYDILVDCFDTALSVDIINKTSVEMNKILIHAAVSETQGAVMTTIPHKTACFRCFMKSDNETLNDSRLQIAGAMAPMCSIISNLQVFEVLKLILNKGNLITNSPLIIEGFLGKTIRPKVYTSKKEKCPVCGLPLSSFEKFYE